MSIKILLADDSITIQKVIGIIFGGEEYSLTVVDNGKAALEKALEIIPDILLIDALMPGMSGYEVCEQIRATPELAAKPILLLTGSFEPFDEDKAKSCGADDFISKPFESQQIIAKVTELCELSAGRSFEAGQDETEAHQAELPPEEADSASWTPVVEQSYVFEEQAAADIPVETAAEDPHEEEPDFGNVSFAEAAEPAAVFEEPEEPAEAHQENPEEPADAVVAAPATLTEEQLRAAIAGVSKDVIERIVWEVVPDLAEALIKEAIRKIKEGQ